MIHTCITHTYITSYKTPTPRKCITFPGDCLHAICWAGACIVINLRLISFFFFFWPCLQLLIVYIHCRHWFCILIRYKTPIIFSVIYKFSTFIQCKFMSLDLIKIRPDSMRIRCKVNQDNSWWNQNAIYRRSLQMWLSNFILHSPCKKRKKKDDIGVLVDQRSYV